MPLPSRQQPRPNAREFGLKQVFPSTDDSRGLDIDIVAIHGLDTHSPTTWLAWKEEGNPASGDVHWLRDEHMLPSIVKGARVFTYDWNANTYQDAAGESLLGHADGLLDELRRARKKDNTLDRPVIFIASCFGGLLLIKALHRASQVNSKFKNILQVTAGVVFLGTPFRGSHEGFFTAVDLRVAVAIESGNEVSSNLVNHLKNDEDARRQLDDLVQEFCELAASEEVKFRIICFYETRRSDFSKILDKLPRKFVAAQVKTGKEGIKLVPKHSACLDGRDRIGLDVRHSMLCKFASPDHSAFRKVSEHLAEIAEEAAGASRVNRRASTPPAEGQKHASSEIVLRVSGSTNYGNQIAYNSGTISQFFCLNSNAVHKCHFPAVSIPEDSPQSQLYDKIKKAQNFYESKYWSKAKALFEEVLNMSNPTPQPADTILIRYNLAHTHFALSEFSDAARYFQQMVKIQEEQYEKTERSVSDSRYWLARSFFHLGRYEVASVELQTFVITYEEQGREENDQKTDGRLWLGLAFERLELYENAKEQLTTALQSRETTLGTRHLETLKCRHHLANFLYKRTAYAEAHDQYQILLQIEESLTGPEKAEAAKTRCMLAFCLAKLEQYDEAEPHLQRVFSSLDAYSRLKLEDRRDLGLVCYWLARIALHRDDRRLDSKAEQLLHRAISYISVTTSESTQGSTPNNENKGNLEEELLDCRRLLAIAMRNQGQFAGAAQTFRQIMTAMDESKHGEMVASCMGLATSLMEQRKFAAAKSTLEAVVSTASPIERCRHTGEDLAACLHLLGAVNLELDLVQEGRDCLKRVVDVVPEKTTKFYIISRRLLGVALYRLRDFEGALQELQAADDFVAKNFPSQRPYLNNHLAYCLCEMRRFDEAEPYLRNSFIIYPRPGNGAPADPKIDMVLGLGNYYMGRILLHRKEWEEAVRHLQDALPMLVRRFSLNRPVTLECQYHLGVLYVRLSRRKFGEARALFQVLLNSTSQDPPIPDIRLVSANFWLGIISQMQSKHEDADRYFAASLASLDGDSLPLEPDMTSVRVRWHRAEVLYELDKTKECIELLREIRNDMQNGSSETRTKLNMDSASLLGRCLHRVGQFNEAHDFLKLSIPLMEKKYSSNKWILLLDKARLADSLCELRRFDEAGPLLAQAAAQPDASRGSSGSFVKAIGTYWLGRLAFDRSDWKQASDHLKTAKNLFTANTNDRWKHLRLNCQHFLARILLEEKRYDDADKLLQELVQRQHDSGDIAHAVDNQYWLGVSQYHQSRFDAAKATLQTALDADSSGEVTDHISSRCHFTIGQCFLKARKPREAKIHLEMALADGCETVDYEARSALGRANFHLGLYEEARDNFNALIDQGHSDPETVFLNLYWLGKSFFELKDWDQAKIHFQKAHGYSGKDWATALDNEYLLGQTQYATAEYEAALCHFQDTLLSYEKLQADESILNVPECQIYTGRTLMRLQRSTEALLFFRMAYERRKKAEKPPNLLLAESQKEVCEALHSLGQYAEALPLAFEVLRYQEKVAGADHPSCLQPRLLAGSLAYHTSDFQLAEDLLCRALAQLEFSQTAQVCVPLPLSCYQALHALTLSKLGRTEAARQKAETALKGGHSFGQLSYQQVDGFMDVFGHLVPEEESKTGIEDTLLQLPEMDRALATRQAKGNDCMSNPSQQLLAAQWESSSAAAGSQVSDDPVDNRLTDHGTKQAPSLSSASALEAKRQYPRPKPKPAHLKHRPAISGK